MSVDPSAMPMIRHGSDYRVRMHGKPSGYGQSEHAALQSAPRESHLTMRPSRDTAGQVLVAVAERALERPPRDMHKLVASASKFLLTNLEPAIKLAREVRHTSAQAARSTDAVQLMAPDRNARALSLLTRDLTSSHP